MASAKERLGQELFNCGLLELSKRAYAGEFSDFESDHDLPKVELISELNKIYKSNHPSASCAFRLANEVARGEYDDTKDEAEAWFKKQL